MTAPAFHAEVTPIEGMPQASTMALAGRFTLDEASAARSEILGWLESTEAARIVMELSSVEKMDTAGAAVLAEAVRVGQDRGQRILLCSPSEPVLRIFRLAGFEEVLQCCCADPAETHRRLTS
jgi:anti-anti-sigma factor